MDYLLNSKETNSFIKSKMHISGELNFLKNILRKNMNVIDVGGYYGLISLHIAQAILPNGKIFIFEPFPVFYEGLVKNFNLNNLNNVNFMNAALSNKNEYCEIAIDGDATTLIFDKNEVNKRVTSVIKTITLDTFLEINQLPNIDLINMDCEGSELLVLQGATKLLRERRIPIFCEIHHHLLVKQQNSVSDLVSFLVDLGYDVKSVNLETRSLSLDPNDFKNCDYIYAT